MSNDDLSDPALVLPNIPESLLNDLCSRFLINIPENEKNDMVRMCFQIELAHWYYIDFCRQEDPDLPACGMKSFISKILTDFSFLNKSEDSIQSIYENWKMYKVRVPVFGAILLDESLENCLLVQGYHNKTSWGFPKGKINKDEDNIDCAVREVWEEVGFDISPLVEPDHYLENNFHDHQIRLYLVPGVNSSHNFKPNTRGEIKEICWFPVEFLPTHKKDMTPRDEFGLMPNNFFMIHSFIKPLRKWIAEKKSMISSLVINHLFVKRSVGNNRDFRDKRLEEKEQQQRHMKETAAEDFKRMHSLINPLRSSKEDEDMLKTLLGLNEKNGSMIPVNVMNSKKETSSQPEAIQKLLSGTVSPVNGSYVNVKNPLSSVELRDKPEKIRINMQDFTIDGGSLQSVFPKSNIEINGNNINHGPHPSNGREIGNNSVFAINSNRYQFQPFSSSRIIKQISNDIACKPHYYKSCLRNDHVEKQQVLLSMRPNYLYQKRAYDYSLEGSSITQSLDDFHFSAPAFTNFKLDYKEIRNALNQSFKP